MAAAEIIGTAIGVMLLIIIAYILTASTLIAGETVANAQKDLTLQNEARLRTSISLPNKNQITNTTTTVDFSVANDGNEIISDFEHMDVLIKTDDGGYQHCSYPGQWYVSNYYVDFIHPHELDPGETFLVHVTISGSSPPEWFQITTGNGVSASALYNSGTWS